MILRCPHPPPAPRCPSRLRATGHARTAMSCWISPVGRPSSLPPADALMRTVRAMLTAYREADGEPAILLLHDESHGTPLIDALARFGEGLPAHVLPLSVNEVTQIGLENLAAAFAFGASA